jgi:hypothetical protein
VAASNLLNVGHHVPRLVIGERADQQNQHCRNQRQCATLSNTGELGAQAGLFSFTLVCLRLAVVLDQTQVKRVIGDFRATAV